MSTQLAVTGLIWEHASAVTENSCSLFLMRPKCRSQAIFFSDLNVLQIYFPLEKRGAVSRVRIGVFFLQKITCSSWNWGRVPALVFDFGLCLSVRGKLCLLSLFKVLFEKHTWRDKSHTLQCWWNLLDDHQQSVAVSKFVQRSKSI